MTIGRDVDQPIGLDGGRRCAPRWRPTARSLRCSASTTTISSASRTTLASLSCAVPPPDEQQLRLALAPPPRHAIGIAGEDALPQRRVGIVRASRRARRAARAAAARDRWSAPRRRRARASARDPAAARRAPPRRSDRDRRADPSRRSARRVAAAATRGRARRAAPPPRTPCRPDAARLRLDDEPRLPRMQRKAQHAPPERGDRVTLVDRAEPPQQRARRLDRRAPAAPRATRARRRARPTTPAAASARRDRAAASRAHRASDACRDRAACTAARHRPGRIRPARPARCVAEAREIALHLERRHARPRRVRRHARQPTVDHRDDALDRDRRLGHVGRQDHLAPRTRRHRAILLLRREVAVQRDDVDARRRRDARRTPPAPCESPPRPAGTRARPRRARRRRACAAPPRRRSRARRLGRCGGRAAYSIVTSNRRPSARSDGQPRKPAIGSASSVADITTSFRSCRRACRRRSSASATSPCRCRSWNSSSSTAPTPRSSGSDSSRRVSTPSVTNTTRVRADTRIVEAHAIADRSPTRSPSSSRHASRRHARRQPPRLEHEDLALDAGVEQRPRHARRLARARRRLEHHARRPLQRRDDVGNQRIDRQRHECRARGGRHRSYFCFARASAICCRRCFFSAFSRDCFVRRLAAALSWCRCGMLHRHGASPCPFRSVSAAPLQAPRIAALQTHRTSPLMRRRHRRAALGTGTPLHLLGQLHRRLPPCSARGLAERQHLLVAAAVAIHRHALAPEPYASR